MGLNAYLKAVFETTLEKLEKLGYPGLNNPRIEIRSALNPASVKYVQDARVHYMLGDDKASISLPDTYNGLGYKNLIYMVVEVLDRQEKWRTSENDRTPLHLIFIEEPEAHLHAQLQQVFIRNILELMKTGALTANQTLIKWLPKLRTIAELAAATDEARLKSEPRPHLPKSASRIRPCKMFTSLEQPGATLGEHSRKPSDWKMPHGVKLTRRSI